MSPLRSLRLSLPICLVAAAVVPLAAVLYLTAGVPEESIERQTIAALAAIAEARGLRLEALGQERVRNIASIATDPAFVAAARELGAADPSTTDAVLARVRPRLDAFALACELPRLLLADATGRVVFATTPSPLLGKSIIDTPIAKILDRVRRERRPFISPPLPPESGTRPTLEVVGPVVDGDELVGFACASIAPAEIDRIVTDYTGLGTTGDIVGVCHLGGDVVVTTPMRSNADAAYTVRGKLASDFAPRFQEIVYGNPLRGRGTDIQGADVFGAWVRIQSLGWGMGVTQHVEEALALARGQQAAQKALVRNVLLVSIIPAIILGFLIGGRADKAAAPQRRE